MKWFFKFLIVFSSINFVFAQNWLPIDTAKVYNYISDSSNYITRSIATTQNNDTTFFETIVDSCYYCANISQSDTFLLKRPDFFGYFMFNQFDTSFIFYGYDTITIKPHKDIGESWSYTSNITATVYDKDLQLIGTQQDSIKIIVLSNYDTLLLSKSYGIIKYPYLYKNKTYIQVGIDNLYGIQNITFWNVFDFNIGDIFQYYESQGDADYISNYNYFKRIHIIDKTILINGYRYIVNIKLKTEHETFYQGYHHTETIYNEYEDTIFYYIENDSLLNKPTGSWFNIDFNYYPNSILIASFYDLDESGTLKKIIDIPPSLGNFHPYNGFLIPINQNQCVLQDFERRIEYGLNIGMVLNKGAFFESGFTKELIGYYKGIDTVGTIYNDDFYTSIKNVALENMAISFYPNPTQNQLSIKNKENKTLNISLINAFGQEVYSSTINESTTINTQSFSKGIYIIRVCTEQGICGSDKVLIE